MDYNLLLDFTTDLGYRLAMSGAETFRVEESINRILEAYGIAGEVFAIPNCLTVSMEADDGTPITRMRRVGCHGNDLDAVESYSNLSRLVCRTKPTPATAQQWLKDVDHGRRSYSIPIFYLSHYLGAAGFILFFGGTLKDCLLGGIGGLIIGAVTRFMESLKANDFFRITTASFFMALLAYGLGATPLLDNPDAAIIGPLMLLVPGLLFTNAMRDIIYGDTNSGVMRIVQVFLIAIAIAIGTGAAWYLAASLLGLPVSPSIQDYSPLIQNLGCAIGCAGFSLLFNLHGSKNILCVVGGVLAWSVYLLAEHFSGNDLVAYFWAGASASLFSEVFARICKSPAISYLVVVIFPLIPGASVYYTMDRAVRGDMVGFSQIGFHAIAIAGVLAVSILLVSTSFRLWSTWHSKKTKRRGHL